MKFAHRPQEPLADRHTHLKRPCRAQLRMFKKSLRSECPAVMSQPYHCLFDYYSYFIVSNQCSFARRLNKKFTGILNRVHALMIACAKEINTWKPSSSLPSPR